MIQGCVMNWSTAISLRSRSQCIHTLNPCQDHESSLLSLIWIIFHTLVVHKPMTCHDLHPRYLQGQGQCAAISKVCLRPITPHCQVGFELYTTHVLPITKGWDTNLTLGHISNISRSHCTHTQYLCPGHNFSVPNWFNQNLFRNKLYIT